MLVAGLVRRLGGTMFHLLLFVSALQDLPPQEAAQPSPPTVEEPAPPVAVVRREPLVSFSERGDAAGHTGRVVVETTLNPDGTVTPAVVVQSGRSEFLDADAITTIAEAEFRRLPEQPLRLRLTVEFRPTDALTMKCDEFARQVRWYEAAWPERSHKDTIIYVMTLGYEFLLRREAGAGVDESLGLARTFEPAFARTLVECEQNPGRGYLEVLHRQMR